MKLPFTHHRLVTIIASAVASGLYLTGMSATPAHAATSCATLGTCVSPTPVTQISNIPDPVTNLKVSSSASGKVQYTWTNPSFTGGLTNLPITDIRVSEAEVGPLPCNQSNQIYSTFIGAGQTPGFFSPGHVDTFTSGWMTHSTKCYLHVDVAVRNSAGQWSSQTVWQGWLP